MPVLLKLVTCSVPKPKPLNTEQMLKKDEIKKMSLTALKAEIREKEEEKEAVKEWQAKKQAAESANAKDAPKSDVGSENETDSDVGH